MKFQAPRGTYDILPKEMNKWYYIEKIIKKYVKLFNYREIRLPIFEYKDLFQRSVGDDSDIVEKEMYVFEDKNERLFALRPEGTASVARSYIENSMISSKRDPKKIFYYGPMFRYSRPQKGRYRQFYQFGIEYIGDESAYADAEIITMGWKILQEAQVPDVSLEINSVGCKKCRKDYHKKLQEFLFARENKFCPNCQRRMKTNPLRVFDCKNYVCQEQLENAPQMLDNLCEDCEKHFDEVQENLKKLNVDYEINPRIVRGLDYYTRTAFEYKINYLGAQDALGGGGRYDGLIEYLGGKNTPAVGLSMGMERIILALEEAGVEFPQINTLDVFIIPMDKKYDDKAIEIMNKLHDSEISAQIADANTSMGSNFKFCDRNNVKFAIVIGENEIKSEEYAVKNISKHKQESVHLDKLTDYINSKIE
ncbi:MAG: histidine--tRNA ligase [Candidatus Cloacimonetes bacterium]|nr:histidine--tRNA ligase [Candidatus Cloacimonadota bacterium]MBS3767939.1 histidine--tRNA ligase [Candidatus Cloacimonadota bacterium]